MAPVNPVMTKRAFLDTIDRINGAIIDKQNFIVPEIAVSAA